MGYKHTFDTIYYHFHGILTMSMVLEDPFLLLQFFTLPPIFLPVLMTGLYIKLCQEVSCYLVGDCYLVCDVWVDVFTERISLGQTCGAVFH